MRIRTLRLAAAFAAILASATAGRAQAGWEILLPAGHASHPALVAAAADLRAALASLPAPLKSSPVRAVIDQSFTPAGGYEWRAGGLQLHARSPLALAHGLERLAWLTQSHAVFPPGDFREAPRLPWRFLSLPLPLPDTLGGPPGDPKHVGQVAAEFRRELEAAVRFGFTHVIVSGLENFIPWEDPVYGPRAERYRAYLKAAIAAAHDYDLRILLMGDEVIYLPAWLASKGARPSIEDPRFWDAFQDKYRLLLRAVPELDGIATRIGETIAKHDFQALNVAHSEHPEPNPRLEKRYRTYLARAHQVVAGEFKKIFYHRTWVVNDWEQHSVPSIFAGIFTKLPAENMLVSVKLTKQDQWYYGSAFNPVFGQAPQATIAEGEIYSNYHGFGTTVDFPARWFGAALQYASTRGARGVFTGRLRRGILSEGILYVFSRLAWDPDADPAQLTREWAAAAFGFEASGEVADILLRSADASRHGFYLAPVSLVGWNPLPHIRVDQFVLRGNPVWDLGRGHHEFLRELYLMCKPYYEETYRDVGLGFQIVSEMAERFAGVRGRIRPAAAAEELAGLLAHSWSVMALTRDYARTILSYFAFQEQPDGLPRTQLASDMAALKDSAELYRAQYRHYQLGGVDTLLTLSRRMLANHETAARTLASAPTREQIAERFAAARDDGLRLLADNPGAEKIMVWKGTVDGRQILRIRNREVEVEHLGGDPIHAPASLFLKPVPRRQGRWVLKPVQARGVAHLMEEPSAANEYTASVYLEDPAPGNAVFEFELYRIPL